MFEQTLSPRIFNIRRIFGAIMTAPCPAGNIFRAVITISQMLQQMVMPGEIKIHMFLEKSLPKPEELQFVVSTGTTAI